MAEILVSQYFEKKLRDYCKDCFINVLNVVILFNSLQITAASNQSNAFLIM